MEHRVFTTEVRNVDEKERAFTHAISDESVDGHGSIIKLDAWDLKRFRANPIVLFAHDSQGLPIGRSKKIWKEGGKLMSRTEFAGAEQGHQFAETAFNLVKDGFLKAWSVGFWPKEREPRKDLNDDEKHQLWDPFVYTKVELMEYSLVPVPSNPNALLEDETAGRSFERLMRLAGENKAPDALIARYGWIGVCARILEERINRRLGIGIDQTPRLERERELRVRSLSQSFFRPAEISWQEFWGRLEDDPKRLLRENETTIEQYWREHKRFADPGQMGGF